MEERSTLPKPLDYVRELPHDRDKRNMMVTTFPDALFVDRMLADRAFADWYGFWGSSRHYYVRSLDN